jgi:hypothetical protein
MRKAKIGDKFPKVIKVFNKIHNGDDWAKYRNYNDDSWKTIEEVEIPGWKESYSVQVNNSFHLDCYILGYWEVQKEDEEHYIVTLPPRGGKVRVHKNAVKCIRDVDCYGKERDMYIVREPLFDIDEILEDDENRMFVRSRRMTLDEVKEYVLDDKSLTDEEAKKMIGTLDFVD